MTLHRHRTATSTIICYDFCRTPRNCNPIAHGGVTHREVCRCGAVRHINSNRGYLERGPWTQAQRPSDPA